MNSKQLMSSILQQAMQGQLVPQLDTEPEVAQVGPAPVPDAVPFAIPPKWKWVKLSFVSDLINGDRGPNYPSKSKLTTESTGYPFVSAGDLQNNEISDSSLLFMTEQQCLALRSGHILAGDFLLCIRGSLGKFAIAQTSGGAIASSLVILRIKAHNTMMPQYFRAYLESSLFFAQIQQTKNGTCQPNLGAKVVAEFFVPLPPLEEQRRIVARIEEIRPLVMSLGEAQEQLSQLEADFPRKLKASLLQQAISGQLVPQLDAEPEVAQLGPAPAPDAVPFELPPKWKLVGFERVLSLISGRDLMLSQIHAKDSPLSIPYLTGASQIDAHGDIFVNRWTDAPAVISDKDDILLTCKGTVGKLAINTVGQIHIARQIMAVRSSSQCEPKFVLLLLQAYVSKLKVSAKGVIPGISRKDVLNLWLPLPPLEEQRRIVAKLDELLPEVDKLGSLLKPLK